MPPSCPLCHSVDSTVINFGSLQCRVIRPSSGQCGTKKIFFFPRSAGDTDVNMFHSGQRAMIHSVSQPLALHGGPACLKTLLRFTELPQAGLGPPPSANGLPASHNDSLISATHRHEPLATANSPTVHASPPRLIPPVNRPPLSTMDAMCNSRLFPGNPTRLIVCASVAHR